MPIPFEDKIDAALLAVRRELIRAIDKHGPMRSSHEGYAVISEELDELWHVVMTDDLPDAIAEARQVAAMALRFIVDLSP